MRELRLLQRAEEKRVLFCEVGPLLGCTYKVINYVLVPADFGDEAILSPFGSLAVAVDLVVFEAEKNLTGLSKKLYKCLFRVFSWRWWYVGTLALFENEAGAGRACYVVGHAGGNERCGGKTRLHVC